ncbi:TraV family lipoprotein [Edwardsiella tarda]|uniref:TraV family lipoprotein n=1 Tax=Edwardsiella tarda TaxID=636 RepID=UPI001FA75371|nr:TraV family lipoprotein [Edwardsiella tarda]
MNSDFPCNDTVKDRCLTMDEANNLARERTEVSSSSSVPASGAGRVALPPLAAVITPPAVAHPVSQPAPTAVGRPTAKTSATSLTVAPPLTEAPSSPPLAPMTATVLSPAVVNGQAWQDVGMAAPVRQQATTTRLWVAAWIDEQQVWHQPTLVSFEVTPSHWVVQGGQPG